MIIFETFHFSGYQSNLKVPLKIGPRKGVRILLFSLSTLFMIPDGLETFLGLDLAMTLAIRLSVIVGMSKAKGGYNMSKSSVVVGGGMG